MVQTEVDMLFPREVTGWANELVNLICPCLMSDNLLTAFDPSESMCVCLWLTALTYSISISKHRKPRVSKLILSVVQKHRKQMWVQQESGF